MTSDLWTRRNALAALSGLGAALAIPRVARAFGDEGAFNPRVLLTGNADSARDLVQATLVKLYVAWPRIDTPAAYAQRTMVRTFLDGRRKERREADLHRPIDPGRAEPDPAQALTVRQAIAALPPRMRAVVVLRYWEDLTVDQTASAPATARPSHRRALVIGSRAALIMLLIAGAAMLGLGVVALLLVDPPEVDGWLRSVFGTVFGYMAIAMSATLGGATSATVGATAIPLLTA